MTARDEQIVEMRITGATLADIATDFGISRERVRQITSDAGIDAGKARAARRAAGADRVRRLRKEIMSEWRLGTQVDEIARGIGVSVEDVTRGVRDIATDLDRAARRQSQNACSHASFRSYTDHELIAAVRAAGEDLGHPPSSVEYLRFAEVHGGPSLPLIINRLGWANAVRAAGFTPHEARRTYERRWDQESCLAALRCLAAELGFVPSLRDYEVIAQGRDDLPSGATVRNRIGGWTAGRIEMAAHLDSEKAA